MSEEPDLPGAFRALRDTLGGESSSPERTQRLILARARERARKRRRLALWFGAIAAVLAAAVAWAAVSARLGRDLREPAPNARQVRVSGQTVLAPPESAALVTNNGVVPVSPVSAPAKSPASSAHSPVASPLARGSASANSEKPAKPAEPTSVSAEERAAYDAAHRAHFVEHDQSAALRGWDAYLARYPAGWFAQEAAYNRAISLVRLGRRPEARAALAPFASGACGGYRQHEARDLLGVLSADAAP